MIINTKGSQSSIESYPGPYTATPLAAAQTFATDEKKMDDDFTVQAIPYLAVDNPQGGKTITIAS